MAREYARLLVRINQDVDFAELDPLAQWLYQRLTARQEINYAGVLPLAPKRWARMSRHVTVDEIEKAVYRLSEADYLVVDEDTDEVLVRSLIRNDEVFKQPNVLRSALRAAVFVESPTLRRRLAVELSRLRTAVKESVRPELEGALFALDPDGSARGGPNPSRNPSDNPSRKGSNTPSAKGAFGNPSAKGSQPTLTDQPFPEPLGEPPVVVEVEVEGVTSPTEVVGGSARTHAGARAGARDQAPPKTSKTTPRLAALYADPDNDAPCRRHPDDDRPCRRCGDIREKRPEGYDPRPPELIPDDQLDVEAWAGPRPSVVAPADVENGDPAERAAWYRQASEEQRDRRRSEARTALADYQASHP